MAFNCFGEITFADKKRLLWSLDSD
jgi:hypothetical protein